MGKGGSVTLDQVYPALRDAWISGGSALSQAPQEWKKTLGDDPTEAGRRLLALAAALLEVGFRPTSATEISPRSDLPVLDKATMPMEARQYFCASMRDSHDKAILALVDHRGYSAHALDWFPEASSEGIPQTYLPWQNWLQGVAPDTVMMTETLDDDTWDYLIPNERMRLIRQMRAIDPDEARRLIANHLPSMQVESRLRYIQVLETNLSMADADFLSSLSTDRSGRVKRIAAGYLSRLGVGSEPSDDLQELVQFLDVQSKGLITKTLSVKPRAKTNHAQQNRREELFKRFTVADLSGALHMSPSDLIQAWHLGDTKADASFAQMAETSASDEDAHHLAMNLISQGLLRGGQGIEAAMILAHRAGPGFDEAAIKAIFAHPPAMDYLCELHPSQATWASLKGSALRKHLFGSLNNRLRPSFLALGFILTPEACESTLAALIDAGVHPQDFILAPLRLNLALTMKET